MTVEIPAEIRAALDAARKPRKARARKLDDDQIRQIKALRAEGESFADLAAVYGVSAQVLSAYAKLDLDAAE